MAFLGDTGKWFTRLERRESPCHKSVSRTNSVAMFREQTS